MQGQVFTRAFHKGTEASTSGCVPSSKEQLKAKDNI